MSALLFLPVISFALPTPAYLSVPDFNACLALEQEGTQITRCLPAQQQASCPDSSWQALLKDNIPLCLTTS
jgi:hypothetical protein